MNFYNRKKVYLIVLIVLLMLIPIFYLIFNTYSPGLKIDANLELEPSPKIVLHINNTSSHNIDNLEVYVNNEKMYDLNTLDSNKIINLEYPALTESISISVKAHNYLGYEKSFSLDKSLISNVDLQFKPLYAFNKAGKESDLSLNICNDSSENEFTVELILDDGELKQGNLITNIDLEENKCTNLLYKILYINSGEKKIKFKIYNDVYNRELLISGSVGQ